MDILIIKSSISALVISIICTPILIVVSRKKGFYASINHRSSHDKSVPNTGGIILCFSVVVPLIIYSDYPKNDDFNLLISAFAVLLITGIIDDFNPIPVLYKFLGQFIPAIVIVTSIDEHDLIIPYLNDVAQIPLVFNYLFWIIFIVMNINAFNLIDGIDGLAIGLGIIGSSFYFFEFSGIGESNLMIFSISLCLGLLGLLFFNLSKKYKIFLGDTGSLFIGGLLVYFALQFIDLTEIKDKNNSFFMALGIIFIPFADMIRVTLIRIINGDSPFKADRQHIHHLVLRLTNGNHLITTGILLFCQIAVVFIFKNLSQAKNQYQLIIILGLFLLYFLSAYLLKKKKIGFA